LAGFISFINGHTLGNETIITKTKSNVKLIEIHFSFFIFSLHISSFAFSSFLSFISAD